MELVGKNVKLTNLRTDDEAISLYTKWMNILDVARWLGHSKSIMTPEDEKEWANENVSKPYNFNIVAIDRTYSDPETDDEDELGYPSYERRLLCETEVLIGNCSIDISDRNACLGICIGEEMYHNRGLGTEVINLLLDYCFQVLDMHNVWLHVNSANKRAYKCYTKCGFKETVREKESILTDGKWTDCVTMQVLEDEYRELRGIKR